MNRTISQIGKLRELPPKTKKSRAPVPVVLALHELLEEHHRDCPNPKAGPIFASIFRDGHWTISLDNLRTRQMLQALNRCKHSGLADCKKRLKEPKDGHKFERDIRIVTWRGWHCAGSGVATTLDAFGVSLNVICRTLRHSKTSVTANHYIKPNLDAVSAGMRQRGEKIAVRNRPDHRSNSNFSQRSQRRNRKLNF